MQLAPVPKLVDVLARAPSSTGGARAWRDEIEWKSYPSMQENPNFAQLKPRSILEALVLFCAVPPCARTPAARLAGANGYANCYNVLEGFGRRQGRQQPAQPHRRLASAGLPWYQGWRQQILTWPCPPRSNPRPHAGSDARNPGIALPTDPDTETMQVPPSAIS